MAEPSTVGYSYLVYWGGAFAFFTAMGIGANDVANAFSSSVGSKSLTIAQAVAIASVMELSGALLLGSHVTETIRSGIADAGCFAQMPAVLMWGMVAVCFSTGCWLLLATRLELPVSTTHSVVGGVIGMALVGAGEGCVRWAPRTARFPYVGGVASIAISWLVSPTLAAALAAAVFATTRRLVLRAPDPAETTADDSNGPAFNVGVGVGSGSTTHAQYPPSPRSDGTGSSRPRHRERDLRPAAAAARVAPPAPGSQRPSPLSCCKNDGRFGSGCCASGDM